MPDLRDLPLIERKRRLKKLLGRAKRRSIQFVEHLTGDGPTMFRHVCAMGLERRTDARTAAGQPRCGSRRRTQRAMPCAVSVKRSDDGGSGYCIVAFTVMTDLPEPYGPFPTP